MIANERPLSYRTVGMCSHVSGMIVSYLGHIDFFSNFVKRSAGREGQGRGRARKRGEKEKGGDQPELDIF